MMDLWINVSLYFVRIPTMSAASLFSISASMSFDPGCHLSNRRRENIPFSSNGTLTRTSSALRPLPSSSALFFNLSNGFSKRSISSIFTGVQSISPVMELQDCTVKMEVNVPISVAYSCYSDREAIPRWMPFISSVKILEDKPELSRWSLKYNVLGQDVEFSWIALNMQPTPNQKIHWRSMEGLPNNGTVRFYPKGPSSCVVELTVSYEVPQLLAPVGSALRPLLESLLRRCLESFSAFARTY